MINKYKLLSLTIALCLIMAACDGLDQTQLVIDMENEELKELNENDFILRIDGLPYRGAVILIDYVGKGELVEPQITYDISQDGEIKQSGMGIEWIDGQMIAELIDLMYQPGRTIDVVLKVQEVDDLSYSFVYSLDFDKYYPWKDWIFDLDEQISLKIPGRYHNFKYIWPGIGTGLESHASWDFMANRNRNDVKVYSGTEGVILVTEYRGENNVFIYNPYVGAIIQNGHLVADPALQDGQMIYPGDYIGQLSILNNEPHNHYSVIRPLGYTQNYWEAWFSSNNTEIIRRKYYWPIVRRENKDIFDTEFYQNPYYFHEPTFMGYWHEDTLPEELHEQMLEIFLRDNPEAILIEAWVRGEKDEAVAN